MNRDLAKMAAAPHDLLIIGGGITGACIARDATLRGLKVALVEKNDFSSATSSGSSKLVHGGLRYLANFELSLVRESLRERRIWEEIAPHMVSPVPFLVPVYGARAKFVLSIGLTLYDILSYDRNRVSDPDKKMPAHTFISRDEALTRAPYLSPEGLSGAMIYYDCQMYSPERIGIECVGDAADRGAHVANYAEVVEVHADQEDGRRKVTGARVIDRITGETHDVAASVIVNAAGPWADLMMAMAEKGQPSRRLLRSKGIHLITRDISGGMALAVQPKGGGHFFVIPWRGRTIIGTTDTVFKGSPDELGVTEQDISDFIAVINQGLPGLDLTRAEVEHFYAGLRPLVDTNPNEDGEKDSYGASRASEVVDHGEEGFDGFLSAIGGKWTTSRHLAETVVETTFEKLGRPAPRCVTAQMPIQGGEITRYRDFEESALERYPDMDANIIRNLARNYGSRMDDVIELSDLEKRPELLEPLSNAVDTIGAQAIYSIRTEMARTLDDILQRRTGLGTTGHPGEEAMRRLAAIVADELGWDAAETARQIEIAERRFRTRAAP